MRLTNPRVLPFIFGLSVLASEAGAQAPTPAPGDRVRVKVCERAAGASCRYLVGSFVSWTPDRISVRDSLGRDLQITAGPRSAVQVSRGRHPHFGKGMLFGLLGGAGLGGILTFACAQDAGEDAGMCVAWLPLGAGAGAVVGGFAGALSSSERWTSARRPEGLTIAPSRQGVRVGFSQSF
jgi:hypothetical protein